MRLALALCSMFGVRFAAAASAALLPLYWWPSEDGTCWPEIKSAATAHPDLSWIIILNPNSGPSEVCEIQPLLDCIPQLRSAISSLKLLGYVATKYGERAIGDVVSDINTYAAWSSAEAQSTDGISSTAALDGIFLDEMPNENSGNFVNLYLAYARYAREQLGSEEAFVVMNPGTASDAAFYAAADMIVSYETSYDTWSSSSISSSDDMPYSKQAIMIHSLPKGDSSTVSSLLDTLVTQDKVGAIWLSDLNLDEEDIYASLSEGFSDVVAGVDERNSALSTKRRARRAARLQVV